MASTKPARCMRMGIQNLLLAGTAVTRRGRHKHGMHSTGWSCSCSAVTVCAADEYGSWCGVGGSCRATMARAPWADAEGAWPALQSISALCSNERPHMAHLMLVIWALGTCWAIRWTADLHFLLESTKITPLQPSMVMLPAVSLCYKGNPQSKPAGCEVISHASVTLNARSSSCSHADSQST